MLDRDEEAKSSDPTNEKGQEIAESADSFARSLTIIGESCAHVLALLNDVTAEKRESILELAEHAAAAEHDQAAQQGQNAHAPARSEITPSSALAAAVKKAEHAAASLGAASAPSPIGLLEHAVVQAIAMAIQNTVAANQQLDILGQAILTRAAKSLLDGPATGAARPTAPGSTAADAASEAP
jgi:hypothetical protein